MGEPAETAGFSVSGPGARLTLCMTDQSVTVNRRARHDYAIDETLEAGIVLTGTEIKSIRAGKVNLSDAYARVERGEAWLIGAHIAPYEQGNRFNHDPTHTRKLLLHRDQIAELSGRLAAKGLTVVPLRLYIRKGLAKLELGIGRGKKTYDKRRTIRERDARRQLEIETKERVRL
jgi:SsrA-binding protein